MDAPAARPARPRAVVLVSGGLDSATTLALAIERGYDAFALTIRYGQRHAVEIERAARLARALGAHEHRVVSIDLAGIGRSALTDRSVAVPRPSSVDEIGTSIPVTYVPARNTVFLALALAWAETLEASDLFFGANVVDYSGYPDCRPEFVEAFERLAERGTRHGASGGRFRIHSPLARSSKAEIVREAVRLGVDLAATVSCYDPRDDGRPCRECDACVLRAKGFAEAGLDDPALAG
jgi:7-cyano-7-deazaguanine synthase